MVVKISKRATQHFIRLMETSNTDKLLLGVKGGGCNGLKYFIEPLYEPAEKNDEIIPLEGKELIICGKSLLYLLGTEIRWTENFMGKGIEFINPNASSSCGCGDTFNV